MKYFNSCKTIEDVKQIFRDLCKKLHPDNGGDGYAFAEMMTEYQVAFNRLKNTHRTQDGETYESKEKTSETPEQFAEIIGRVIHMTGVKIEIIGSWVWLSGNTMVYKDDIKAAGFFWSRSKKAWYYNGNEKRSRRRGHYSMDGLRSKWGAETVATEARACLA